MSSKIVIKKYHQKKVIKNCNKNVIKNCLQKLSSQIVSRIALFIAKVKVSDWLSHWLSEWQSHLLSCSGQLKMYLHILPILFLAHWIPKDLRGTDFSGANGVDTTISRCLQTVSFSCWPTFGRALTATSRTDCANTNTHTH